MKAWKIALFLCLVALFVCAGAQEDPSDSVIMPEPIPQGMFPLTEDPATLRVAAVWQGAGNPATNEFTKYYEEMTGVKVQWDVLTEAEGRQTLNLMLASGEYPDIIMGFWDTTPAQLQAFGQQGIYLRLNDLIEQFGPDIKKIYEQYPLAWDVSTDTDGNIYGLTEVNDCYHCSMINKLWIYKPWLDKLGLEVPTTLEAYQEVLEAFKEQDPNGNGKADEIPLTTGVNVWNGALDPYFMSPFITNPATRLSLTDGKIDVTFNKPEWLEGLRYLKGLYDEGLLDPNSFTQDADQLARLGNAEVPIVGSITTGGTHWLSEYVPEEGARWSEYVVVPPLAGPSGPRVQPSSPYSALVPGRFVITTAAKDPELAMRWANGFFQQQVELSAYWGIEGEGWRWAEEGELGINGKQGLYATLERPENAPEGAGGWGQSNPSGRSSDFRLGEVLENPWDLEAVYYRETEKLEPFKQDPETVVPPLYFTEGQSTELADLEVTLKRYVDEMFARFINGDADLDTGWEEYVATLDQMGLARYLEIYQKAYDAKYAQ